MTFASQGAGIAVTISLILAAACTNPRQPDSDVGARQARHVVVVLCDTLRAANLPIYGYPRDTAPYLSELSKTSLVFENHLANYPGTPWSVSQIMTGRLLPPLLMGFGYVVAPVRELGEDLLVLPDALRGLGYETHLLSTHPWFDDTARILRSFDRVTVIPRARREPYAPFQSLLSDIRRTLERCARSGRRCFVYIHVMDNHAPHRRYPQLQGELRPEPRLRRYDRYDTTILHVDRSIERLVQLMRLHGIDDETVLVVTSDHGEEFNEAGAGWWNRQHGATVRRVQLHVPLLIHFPDGRHAGRRFPGLSRHIDLAPTLLGLLSAGAGTYGKRLDGIDLSSQLESDSPAGARTSVAFTWRYWGIHAGDREVVYDQWNDAVEGYEIRRSWTNYPSSRRVVDPPWLEPLVRQLTLERERHLERFSSGEPTNELLADFPIGVPTTVLHEIGAGPVFYHDPRDDRWFQKVGLLLQTGPDESPPPLGLATPWAPGRYRLALRLDPGSWQNGYQNRFRIEVLGSDTAPVEVSPALLAADGTVPLGEYELGRTLRFRISEPRGGVAIVGFRLQALDASTRRPRLDPGLEQQLRALGYVQ